MSPPTGHPDLTVVVVTHNRCDLALKTLTSARNAMGSLRVQWLVIDSGSTDGTAAAIERAFSDIQVTRCANVGFAGANNHAIPWARGRYVLFLNPDVEVAEGSFATVVARLDESPTVGLASVVQRSPDGSLQYSIRRDPLARRTLAEAFCLSSLPRLAAWGEREKEPALYRTEHDADWLVGALLIVRREALRSVGPFDERFFLYSEETDWCYRFRHEGWRVVHLPLMEVVHHTGGDYRPDLMAQLSYAKVLFADKHYGPRQARAMRTALMLRHATRLILFGAVALGARSLGQRAGAEQRALSVLLGRRAPPFAAVARHASPQVPGSPVRSCPR
jgi:GT2 family glycosyltransferase